MDPTLLQLLTNSQSSNTQSSNTQSSNTQSSNTQSSNNQTNNKDQPSNANTNDPEKYRESR